MKWMRTLQGVRWRALDDRAVELEHGSGFPVEDVTLFLDPSVSPESVSWSGAAPRGWRRWEDWLVVWGTLPPGTRTVVSWKETLRCTGEAGSIQEGKMSALS